MCSQKITIIFINICINASQNTKILNFTVIILYFCNSFRNYRKDYNKFPEISGLTTLNYRSFRRPGTVCYQALCATRHCVPTIEPRITGFSPHNSPKTLSFSKCKHCAQIRRGLPPANPLIVDWVREFGKIWTVSRYISKMVRRSIIVTIDY